MHRPANAASLSPRAARAQRSPPRRITDARARETLMRRAFPPSVQLLLTLAGLLAGMTAVLTRAAYTSLHSNLVLEANSIVDEATRTREQALTQLFQLRAATGAGVPRQRRVAVWRAVGIGAGR